MFIYVHFLPAAEENEPKEPLQKVLCSFSVNSDNENCRQVQALARPANASICSNQKNAIYSFMFIFCPRRQKTNQKNAA
jgi:hypothetical protein